MTTDDFASQLAAAGYGAAEADGRARLLGTARAAWDVTVGRAPEWAWFVPGRIEVFGKHTDYAGGRSLVAAVPRGFAVLCASRSDARVRVHDARWGGQALIDVEDAAAVHTGWATYAAVVVRRLAHNFPGTALGADLVVASDLPRAAGISSSSALVVAVALALIRRGDLARRDDFAAALPTRLDLAGYLGAVENGLSYNGLTSLDGVGTHGGSEDHTAILNCRADHVSAYAYVPVRPVAEAPVPAGWCFVVATSGVHADKAGRVRDQYNRAVRLTRALVDLWNGAHGTAAPTLGAALASAPDAVDRLAGIVANRAHPVYAARDLEDRLEHFIAEDARVPAAARAFREADGGGLGALADASQEDARVRLGNQIPETIALAATARATGAFAASSFGAGFGGSVWALVEARAAAAFGAAWTAAYRAARPNVSGVEWFATRPAPAAVELQVAH